LDLVVPLVRAFKDKEGTIDAHYNNDDVDMKQFAAQYGKYDRLFVMTAPISAGFSALIDCILSAL